MGLIDGLKGVVIAASEEAHGARLRREVESAIAGMQRMTKAQRADTVKLFGMETRDLDDKSNQWTRDGKLKVAANLRASALKNLDFNVVEGYALLMASAWLESGQRTSAEAQAVFTYLDNFAKKEGMESFISNNALIQLAVNAFTFLVAARLNRTDMSEDMCKRFIQDAEIDVIDTLSGVCIGMARALEAASGHPKQDCLMASMAFLYMYGAPRPRIEALIDAVLDRETETTLFSRRTMALVYETIPQADRLMRQYIANGCKPQAVVALLPLVELLS